MPASRPLLFSLFAARRTHLAKVKGSAPGSPLAAFYEGVRLEQWLARPLDFAFIEKVERNTRIRLAREGALP